MFLCLLWTFCHIITFWYLCFRPQAVFGFEIQVPPVSDPTTSASFSLAFGHSHPLPEPELFCQPLQSTIPTFSLLTFLYFVHPLFNSIHFRLLYLEQTSNSESKLHNSLGIPTEKMASTTSALLLCSLLVLDMAVLPYAQFVGARAYLLQQKMECKGGKVYDIDNVQDIEQCKEACRQFDCDAVNLFQVGEFAFKCEILNYVTNLQPANGAACYYAQDSIGGGGYNNGGFNGGFGYPGYGKKRKWIWKTQLYIFLSRLCVHS